MVLLVASLVTGMALSWLVVRWDERRLERRADAGDARAEERLERAWTAPSRDNALLGLAFLLSPLVGFFAVGFHFFRTRSRSVLRPWRWSPWGFLLGLLATSVVVVGWAAVAIGLAYVLGMPLD